MIFQPKLAHAILHGKKTQTRRPVKSNDDKAKYAPGMRRAVQKGRGQPGEFHIVLTDVRMELLSEITLEDAIREGFRTRADFADYWMRLYEPKRWPGTVDVDCPHCDEEHVVPGPECPLCLGDGCDRCGGHGRYWVECPHCKMGVIKVDAARSEEETLERFNARHGDRLVWVLSFTVDRTDRPRLLATGSPHTPGKARVMSPKRKRPGRATPPGGALTPDVAAGYTTSPARALVSAGEAVDHATQQRITDRAGMESEQWQALDHAQRERLDLVGRLATALQEAEAAGVDVHRTEQSILQRIRGIEAKVRRLAA